MLSRQTTINMIAQIISLVVTFGISFFLTPFIVNNIGIASYGYVGLANNFISYAQIITVALNSMAGRFITVSLHKNDIIQAKKYFTSVFISNVLMTLVLTIPIVLILLNLNFLINIPVNLIGDVTVLVGLFFLNFLFSIIGSVFGVAVFAQNRLDLASVRDITSKLLRVIVLISAFSLFEPKLAYIAISTITATVAVLIINIYYTNKLLPNIKINKKFYDFSSIKEILSSGVWNSFTQLSSILSKGLSLLVSNLFIGPNAMGVLSVSQTIPNIILTLFATLSKVFAPELTISFAKNDSNSMRAQLVTSIKFLGFFATIPLVILYVYGDIFFSLWIPNQNSDLLHSLSILMCIGFTFALPMEGLWNIFTAVNKVKQTSVFLFINAILTILLILIGLFIFNDSSIRLYVIAGAEALISLIRSLTFLPLYGAFCLDLKLTTFYPAIVKNGLSLLIISFISMVIKSTFLIDNWFSFLMVCIVTAIISIFINGIFVLGKPERRYLFNMIIKTLKRGHKK
ncbi:oligosaccharide flippase family protein [Bacillus infantis]|uniref:oligosaccharide flippase family protein n=1 Tax=Bacillus infantis TaxID=324767 RepID=UPI00344DA043